MKTAVMKLKDIRPAAYNPRVTLKPGDKDYEALKTHWNASEWRNLLS